jgi:serine/threonine-protein kinase
MVTTELGACEWFVWDLRRSNLLDRGQLDQVVSEFLQQHPRAEPAQLADYLVAQGIISPFQAERLLQGKTQGFVLGPFTLMDALGVGSMGTVYKAVSKTDNQWYAVKVLPRRSMWNVRIARRKVRAFEACRHRTVVPFVDVGTSGGLHYLAWPFVEGETLEKKVQRDGKLTPEHLVRYAFELAEGLEVCHQQGLFHGLFKPSNVMVGPQDELYILDLGIGCLLAETEGESLVDTMSTANSVASGLDCASPESIMDPTNLSPLGDQYSLGCVMYFGLTGRYPFPDGTAAEKMMAHQFKEPTPIQELNPDVPGELVAVVTRLMQKTPEKRFGSSGELVEALRHLGGESAAPAPAPRGRAPLSAPAAETPPLGGMPRPALPTMANLPARGAKPASEGRSTPVDMPRPGGLPATPRPGLPGGAPGPRTAVPTMHNLPRLGASASTGMVPSMPGTAGRGSAAPLPNRQSLRDQVPHLPQQPAAPPAVFDPERVIPGGFEMGSGTSWSEKLKTIGLAAGALVAAALAWMVASHYF